jgi:hypothetical protein
MIHGTPPSSRIARTVAAVISAKRSMPRLPTAIATV